jgi:TonB family protein
MVELPVEQEQQQPREPELELLIDWEHGWNRPKPLYPAIGSVIAHLVIATVFAVMPARDFVADPGGPNIVVDVRKSVPLIAPPDILTQKAPNQSTPAKQLDLAGLMARPEQKPVPAAKASPPPVPAPKQFTAPPSPVAAAKKPETVIQDAEPAPKIAQNLPPVLGSGAVNPTPVTPPPQYQQEKPKLAFETPGAVTGSPRGQIQVPTQMSVADVAKAAVKRGAAGGTVISDLGGDPTPGLPPVPGTQGKTGNALELLSDPMGVDFRPYLIRVLAAVRRNWFAVMPESAHMGMRGKAVIQFAIAKDGSVPKLVIQSPSGSDHLDRAAVAGISASNPFPPLPAEFKGDQIRLALVFAYNMPRQ